VAMGELMALWKPATRVVAYNAQFDHLMIELSAQRTGFTLGQCDLYCAMRESAKLISGSGRWLKLGVAYRCFFGHDLENAHDAMCDVRACMAVYFALQDGARPVQTQTRSVRGGSLAKQQRRILGEKEVEEHQAMLDQVTRLHATPLSPIDWPALAAEPKPEPPKYCDAEEASAVKALKAYRPNFFQRLLELDRDRIADLEAKVEEARERDQVRYTQAIALYKQLALAARERRHMARRVIAGDLSAYAEVMDQVELAASPLLARGVIHSFVSPSRVEVFIDLNTSEVIPDSTKSLLASGRVSVKKAKKREFAGLYQDHLCSAALRIARDFMAMLPIRKVLIHGHCPAIDPATGHTDEQCIMSCLVNRAAFEAIEFATVDATECLTAFPHAMKFVKGLPREVKPLTFAAGS
jgi:hypothetical protein